MSTPAAAPAASATSSAPTSSAPTSSSSTNSVSSSTSPIGQTGANANPGAGSTGTAEGKVDANAAQAAANGQTPAQKAEEIRKWKLKAKTGEVELTEAELIRRAQLGLGADEKFQEAAQMRKSAEALFEAIKKDPIAVMKHMGLNVRDLTEGYLAKELQDEMKDPQVRELEDLRAFKKAQEDAKANADKENMTKSQQAEFQQHMQRTAKEYDTKISQVLADSNLPKTPYTVKRVAELLKNALTKGYDLDVNTAVDMVREGYMGDFKALFGGLKGEQLVKFLGDDVLKEMRQHDLARIKAKLEGQHSAAQPAIAAPSTPRQSSSESKQMSTDEWKDFIRKKAGV